MGSIHELEMTSYRITGSLDTLILFGFNKKHEKDLRAYRDQSTMFSKELHVIIHDDNLFDTEYFNEYFNSKGVRTSMIVSIHTMGFYTVQELLDGKMKDVDIKQDIKFSTIESEFNIIDPTDKCTLFSAKSDVGQMFIRIRTHDRFWKTGREQIFLSPRQATFKKL